MEEQNHKPILLAVLFALICILVVQRNIPLVWGFPSSNDDRSFIEHMRQVDEADMQNSRTKNAQRKASEDKYPWKDEGNFLEMEGLVWPSFSSGRDNMGINFGKIDPKTGEVGYPGYQSGCAFYQPNIITGNLCDDSTYVAHLGILQGVITGYKSTGPANVQPSGMNFVVERFRNASYGSKINIEVFTRNLDNNSEGKCNTSINVFCEDCECVDAEPTILSGVTTIDPGGTASLYVDSDGLACPPYNWSVSGLGYTLNKKTTNNDLETVTLICANGG